MQSTLRDALGLHDQRRATRLLHDGGIYGRTPAHTRPWTTRGTSRRPIRPRLASVQRGATTPAALGLPPRGRWHQRPHPLARRLLAPPPGMVKTLRGRRPLPGMSEDVLPACILAMRRLAAQHVVTERPVAGARHSDGLRRLKGRTPPG